MIAELQSMIATLKPALSGLKTYNNRSVCPKNHACNI